MSSFVPVLRDVRWSSLVTWLICAGVLLACAWFAGPVAFVSDSLYLATPAKILSGRVAPGAEPLFFFYRPLISLLWMPAWLLDGPIAITNALLAINALVYATALWPLRWLLEGYVGLSRHRSLIVACVLLLNPCTLIYVPALLTEAIYVPVFLFTVFAAWRRLRHPGVEGDAVCGLLLALCYLSRHAGSIVPVAWGVAEGVRILVGGENGERRWTTIRRAAVVVAVAAVPVAGWQLINGWIGTTQGSAGRSLLTELAGSHDHLAAWTINLLEFVLWSPLGALTLLGVVAMLFSFARFLRDATAQFVFAAASLAILSTVLFQGSHWGDESLTLNRYLAPYVVPMVLVAWRYVGACRGWQVALVFGVAVISLLIGFPLRLNTHFDDYLAWTHLLPDGSLSWQRGAAVVFGTFSLLVLLFCWRRWNAALVALLAIATIPCSALALNHWRSQSEAVTRPAMKSAAAAWREIRETRLPIFTDAHYFTSGDTNVQLLLCFFPESIARKSVAELRADGDVSDEFLYVSRSVFTSGRPDPSAPIVWRFEKPDGIHVQALGRAFPVHHGVHGESATVKRKATIHRIADEVAFSVETWGKKTPYVVTFSAVSPKLARNIVVSADGEEKALLPVPVGRLRDGLTTIDARLDLEPGLHRIDLRPDGPLVASGKNNLRLIVADDVQIRLDGQP